jgi:hypothetical protein
MTPLQPSTSSTRRRERRWALRRSAAAALAATLACPGLAHAEPQSTAAATLGVAGTGDSHAVWRSTTLHAGLRGDVLFGRSSGRDFGVGPYAELGTVGFRDAELGVGASLLLPVNDTFPVVVSGGVYGRAAEGSLEPGLAAQLFWGTRSYNFDSSYGMAAGVLVQARYGLGAIGGTAIIVGAQLDLRAASLPFVMLVDAVRGTSNESARLPR